LGPIIVITISSKKAGNRVQTMEFWP